MSMILRFTRFALSATILLAITVGTPVLLLHLTGNPAPEHLPGLARTRWLLTHQVPDGDWPRLLTTLAWVAWAWLGAGIAAQSALALTHQAQRRVPLIGPSQVLAAALLAPVLAVMLHTTPAFSAGSSPASPASGQPVTAAPSAPLPAIASASATPYVVQPGDTLWGIAEVHDGNGEDWHAIWNANEGRVQSDGRSLSDPDLILPGWQLNVPAQVATGVSEPPVQAPAATVTPRTDTPSIPPVSPSPSPAPSAAPAARVPAASEHPERTTPPTVEHADAPRAISHATRPPSSVDGADRSPASVSPASVDGAHRSPADRSAADRIAGDLAAAGLIAGGFLLALDRYRRRQAARRPEGRRPRSPRRRARLFEERVRQARPLDTVDAVAQALGRLEQAGTPSIRALRITDDEVLVLPAERGDLAPPEDFGTWPGDPWWHLGPPTGGEGDIDSSASSYPTVVSVGSDGTGLVLADLEAFGAVAIDADDPDRALSFARAMVTELSWSPWAAHSGIYVYGELGLVDTDERVARLTTTGAVLDLARRVNEEGAQVMARTSSRDTGPARSAGELGGCTIIVSTEALGAMVADEVAHLAHAGAGLVLVTLADQPAGAAVWRLRNQLVAGQLGPLAPVLLTVETASIVREVVATTEGYTEMGDAYDLVALGEPRTVTEGQEAVTVRVLGPVVVDGAARALDRRSRRLVAYLATHGGRVERWRWIDALWEGSRVADGTVWNTVSAARKALGGDAADPDAYLFRDGDFLCLGSRVHSDIEDFKTLSGSERPEDWTAAVALIRGRPFADIIDDGWLASDLVLPDIEARIVDVVAKLASWLLETDRAAEADEVARKGLTIVPWDESLYRLRMRAMSALSGPTGVKQVWKSWHTVNDDMDPSPESVELYAALTARSGDDR